jgi:phosphotransferase system HPr-like phosphotransfer protein
MTPGNGSSEKKIYISFAGLPLTFDLNWPFHLSTSGSDWHVLHGTITVENASGLHAKVAVNLLATVAEVMPSLEAKDAEAPVINALRKEVDRKQVEFLKSGKLLPIHFSSRHYDFKHNRWVFEKATDEQITTFLLRKIYWQTRATDGEVWIADTTDAQYLDITPPHLSEIAGNLAKQGWWTMERAYARASEKLMTESQRFERDMQIALEELENKHAFERG